MFQHGHDVVLVARGEHRAAIAASGLTVEWPDGSVTLPVPVVGHPDELSFRARRRRRRRRQEPRHGGRRHGPRRGRAASTPIVCLQNGVVNEVAFLRRFAAVHGVTVMAPTWHLEPGVVRAYTPARRRSSTSAGGHQGSTRSPRPSPRRSGSSGFESVARPDIARWKYAKLLLNLGNPVDALSPRDDDARRLHELARAEGETVLAAAGIDHVSEADDRARRGDILRIVPIGRPAAAGCVDVAEPGARQPRGGRLPQRRDRAPRPPARRADARQRGAAASDPRRRGGGARRPARSPPPTCWRAAEHRRTPASSSTIVNHRS